MAYSGSSAAVEAEEMIRNWLSKVEATSSNTDCIAGGISAPPSHTSLSSLTSFKTKTEESRDILSGVDWESGSVTDTTKSILDALLTKDISRMSYVDQQQQHRRTYDPRVAMEKRHQQVKDRRVQRDNFRRQQLESQLLLEQAQREAREIVMKEEKEARKKAAIEEKLINQQISIIRGQIREQRKSTNKLAKAQRMAIEAELKKKKRKKKKKVKIEEANKALEDSEHEDLADILLTSPTVVMAEKIVEDERKRQQTRSELVRQLEEAETRDLKEKMRLLRGYFSAWYEEMVSSRAKVRKAGAVRDWKLMARVWGAWHRWAVYRRNRREEAAATREMQRNMRLYQVASQHHESSLLLRVLRAWYRVVRIARLQRREREEEENRRRKMNSLLQAAIERSENRRTSPPPTHLPLHPHTSNMPLPLLVPTDGRSSSPTLVLQHSTDSAPTAPPTSSMSRLARKPPVPRLTSMQRRSETAVYKVARQEVTELLQEVQLKQASRNKLHSGPGGRARLQEGGVAPVPGEVHEAWGPDTGVVLDTGRLSTGDLPKDDASMQQSPGEFPAVGVGRRSPAVSRTDHRRHLEKFPVRPKPRPVTKPVAMTGMESRAAAAAERKLARERRREELQKERAEQQAREEQERLKAEQLAKEAALQQRREERRLAKLKEQEKQRKLHLQEELNKRATNHYHEVLLRTKGLVPWKRFVAVCQENWRAANVLSRQQLQRRVLTRWRVLWQNAEEGKEGLARELYYSILVRRTWRAWRESMELSEKMEGIACKMYPRLLVKTCFLGWKRVVDREQTEYWEKCARAKRFRRRFQLTQLLGVWRQYVPKAKEERARQKRIALLRQKVATWLPDFIGNTQDSSNSDEGDQT